MEVINEVKGRFSSRNDEGVRLDDPPECFKSKTCPCSSKRKWWKKTSSYILRADIRILLDMSFWIFTYIYPLVNIQKAIENGHLNWIYPLKNVIFHSKLLVYQRVCTSSLQSITRIPEICQWFTSEFRSAAQPHQKNWTYSDIYVDFWTN